MARCGRLAELPRTTPDQLVRCFEQTCNCQDKNRRQDEFDEEASKEQESRDEMDMLRQYFSLIHDRERVSYLILQ